MKSVLAAIAAILLLTGSSSALCATPQDRLVCAEYFHEQAVVIAKLVRSRHVVPKGEDASEYDLYTLETTELLRGKIPHRFVVVDEDNSGRSGVLEDIGESYLLFLSYVPQYKAWGIDGCSNSDSLKLAGDTLQAVRQLQTGGQQGGTIHGLVWPAPGASVLVRAINGNFKTTTTTDGEGEFHVHVPAGTYRVWPVQKGKKFQVDLFSYQNPRKIKIVNGGCAQMQFNDVEHSR